MTNYVTGLPAFLRRRFHRPSLLVLVIASLVTAPLLVWAEDSPNDTTNTVVVTGSHALSYRIMLAGLDAFDEYHDLAPTADKVYFKLKPGKDSAETSKGLALRIVGDTVSVPVPVSPDGSFSVPRIGKADDEDADLVFTPTRKNYSLRIDVFSNDVPKDMRRLGDLRLECEVGMAMAKKNINIFLRATATTFLHTSRWCMADEFKVPSYSERPLLSATVINGSQRNDLTVLKDRHSYEAPINDKKYPDDALIEFRFDEVTDKQ